MYSSEKRMIRIDREAKTEGSLSNLDINFITDLKVGLINDSEYVDVIINRYDPLGSNELFVHLERTG